MGRLKSSISSVSREPFPCIIGSILPSQIDTNKVESFLHSENIWIARTNYFYHVESIPLVKSSLLSGIPCVQTYPRIFDLLAGEVCNAVSQIFGLSQCTLRSLSLNKMIEGDYVLPHNDMPEATPSRVGGVTHRAVVYLSKDWENHDGGELRLLYSSSASDVRLVVSPVYFRFVAFEISQRSYHSVQRMRKGIRYSMLASYSSSSKDL